MKSITVLLALGLLAAPSYARSSTGCSRTYWQPHGKVMGLVRKFDRLLMRNLSPGDRVKALNAFKDKYGLPVPVSFGPKIEGIRDYLEGDDDLGGPSGVIFLKSFRLPKGSSASFDSTYEVASLKSTEPIHTWNSPYNWGSPQAVSGDELTFPFSFSTLCEESKNSVGILFAVRPDGRYRIMEKIGKGFAEIELVKSRCPAKALFKHSDYVSCGRIIDLKTKKKRIFVFQMPMT